MNAKHFIVLLSVFTTVMLANTVNAADWIYATVDFGAAPNNDVHLIQIDVNTGTTTDIGECTVKGQPGHSPALTGLSMHTDGQLYAFDAYDYQIVTIDTKTAVATKVTDAGPGFKSGAMYGLAIEPNGDYYVTDEKIHKGTLPNPTTYASPEYDDTDSCDLAADGTLYATDHDVATDDSALLTINKTNGVRNKIQTWTDTGIAGIAVEGSIAWAIDNGDATPDNQQLVKINLSTGDLTYLYTLPDGWYLATALPNPNQEGIFFPIKSKKGKVSVIYLE